MSKSYHIILYIIKVVLLIVATPSGTIYFLYCFSLYGFSPYSIWCTISTLKIINIVPLRETILPMFQKVQKILLCLKFIKSF